MSNRIRRFLAVENSGFTLVEIIISILILAVVSGVVIQLFMTSKDLGDRARANDLATVNGANAVEILKSLDNPQAFQEKMTEYSFFEMAEVVNNNTVIYYDANFNVATENVAVYILEVQLQENTDSLELVVQEYFEEEGQEVVSVLYDIVVDVIEIESNKVMSHQETGHYYTYVR